MKARGKSPNRLSVYQRIVRAYKKGAGLRLTPNDVTSLAFDDAVMQRAELDDDIDTRNCSDGWHEDNRDRQKFNLPAVCPSCHKDG